MSPAGEDRGGRDAIIWEMEPHTRRFTYVSGRAASLLGYPLGLWLSEPDFWCRILHPDDRERADALCRDATENLIAHEMEYRMVAADGRVVWVRDSVNVVRGEDGRARLLQGVMVDITAQKAAEANVQRAELQARRMADRMGAIAAAAAQVIGAESIEDLRAVLDAACAEVLHHDEFVIQLAECDASTRETAPELAPASTVIRSPIVEGESVLGTLIAATRDATPYDANDQAVLDILASLAAMALVNLRGSSETARTRRALRNSEALSTLLQEVTAAAIEARTFNEAAAKCLAAICAHTGWPTAHVFVRTDEGDVVSTGIWEITAQAKYREITSVASRIRYRPGIGVVGRVLATGEPVWVSDVTADPAFLRRREGSEVRGAFAFPVVVGGQVAAVLEFLSRHPVAADSALISLSRRMGGQLARVIERERAEERIHVQARLLDSVGEAVLASDAQHRVIYWNRAAETLFGWSREDALGRTDSELLPARANSQQTAEITSRLAAGQSWSGEFEVKRKDGTAIPVHITGSVIHDENGALAGYVGVATDLRETKLLERRLRQAQRLEAVGRLAGGVAHDFNNLLTSIRGVTLLLLDDLPEESPLRPELEEIRRAADRAASLTAQLLAFSRRQVLKPRVLDLNTIVREATPVLRRLVGESVELVTELSPDSGLVKVDAVQIGQAVVNLAVNARDAMPEGGRVVIRTAAAELPARPGDFADDVRAGPYVLLEIEDQGCGIAPTQLEHIFEPFFTTKHRDVGVGLGLSTVHGIVKQSDGHIAVDSTVGSGTTFRIYLPQVTGIGESRAPEPTPAAAGGGSETLLLVEDEDSVRRLARKILDRQGYTVLEASNGLEALEICAHHNGRIDLVVSDVVMPHMSGAELIERLQHVRPGLPVLLMSGYTANMIAQRDLAVGIESFLEKPFTPDALARKVRGLLDAVAHEAES